jgi:L-threonylcarbamoyladenylate synthase
MEIINNPTHDEIKKAAQALKDGHLVAFPTETVYGLGADATNEKAISRIYSVKGRPTDHPLIVHISSINQLDIWAIDIPDYAIKLAKEFWPGPMTLILKRSYLAKDFITGGQENVGLRVPDQSVALALLSEFEKLGGVGVAAPSANRFGAVSPTTADAVMEELGNFLNSEDSILNGGQCVVGIESTILDCTTDFPTILRPGAVTAEMIKENNTYKTFLSSLEKKIITSGQSESHYAPHAQVIIDGNTEPGDGFIAMADHATPVGAIRLAAPNNLEEYGKILYSAFRFADKLKLNKIVIKMPEGNGFELAIQDRILKSSRKSK